MYVNLMNVGCTLDFSGITELGCGLQHLHRVLFPW